MNHRTLPLRIPSFALLAALLLSACALPRPARQAAQVRNEQATQAAYRVLTEIARPTGTLAPTPTLPLTETLVPPSPTPSFSATPVVRVTARPGWALHTHPDVHGYVFQFDPALWAADPGSADLVHQAIGGCRIAAGAGQEPGAPERLLYEDFGRFRWEIMDYETRAFARPILGNGLVDSQAGSLLLEGYGEAGCRGDQEDVLANLMTLSEAEGQVTMVMFRSPTPRPALEGFDCPDTPPARVRVGDEVAIVASGLWLRSEPRVDNSTRVRQFLGNPPYRVRVIGGPVCETYVYWQVDMGRPGAEDGEALQGWLAEGDAGEYYIVPIR